jgi:hypothetical protein
MADSTIAPTGLATSYPVNAVLIARGVKTAM